MIDQVVSLYQKGNNTKEISHLLRLSEQKVRKLLIDGGIVLNGRAAEVYSLAIQGMPAQKIAQQLNISTKAVNSYMPHIKGVYGTGNTIKAAHEYGIDQAINTNYRTAYHTRNQHVCDICGNKIEDELWYGACPVCREMSVAKRIHTVRERRGITMPQLHARLKVPRSTLYSWESGAPVADEYKISLAAVLRVSAVLLISC